VGSFFEAAPEYPTAAARLRVSPDIYGWCRGAPFGNPLSTPYGGECASHQGQMGAHEIDDAILSMLRLR
jgi:hypothetical protein